MTEPVTIGERYRNATVTSNMRVSTLDGHQNQADILIAAGWSDSLGIKLYRLACEFDQVARDMHRVKSTTDAILVLSHIKTLTQARAALVGFAADNAPRWGVTLDPNIMFLVVGKVLSAWLDPNCPRCGGTGTIGGYDGQAANICRRCGGSGKTRHGLGETDAERYFAHRLMGAMDAKMADAERMMKQILKNRA